jgi:hypothetical protein
MSAFLISQLFAAATLVTGMAAFQFRKREHILRGWVVAALFAAAHFWFLEAYEACFLVLATATRLLVSSFTTDTRLMYLFLAIALGGFALTYQTPVSLLALAATLVGTVGSFQKSETVVRYTYMATEILWATHNIIVWTPVAIAMEVLFFISNLIGLLRHRKASETAL